MKCVRCEILRAKGRAIVMHNLGYKLPEICDNLNSAYPESTYAVTMGGAIVRYPDKDKNGLLCTVIFQP